MKTRVEHGNTSTLFSIPAYPTIAHSNIKDVAIHMINRPLSDIGEGLALPDRRDIPTRRKVGDMSLGNGIDISEISP
jgi:hypothetical protein